MEPIEMSDVPSTSWFASLARPVKGVYNAIRGTGGGWGAPTPPKKALVPMSANAVRAPFMGFGGHIKLLCYGVETWVVLHSEALKTLYSGDRSIIEYMINQTMIQRYGINRLDLVNTSTRHIPSIVRGWVAELDSILDVRATRGIARRRDAVRPVLRNLYTYIASLTAGTAQDNRDVIVGSTLYRQPPPPMIDDIDEGADLAVNFSVFSANFVLVIVSTTMYVGYYRREFASDHRLEVPFGHVFEVNDGDGIKQSQERFARFIMLGWLSEVDYMIDSDRHNSNFYRMRNQRSLYDVEKEYIRLYDTERPPIESTAVRGKLPYSRPMNTGGGGGRHNRSSRYIRNTGAGSGAGSRSRSGARSSMGLPRRRIGRM
jgi:hypothetical protein